ncbi:MAG: hypothetical protein ACKVQW_10140 [Pyrinomonadaceae bacterium]
MSQDTLDLPLTDQNLVQVFAVCDPSPTAADLAGAAIWPKVPLGRHLSAFLAYSLGYSIMVALVPEYS